MSNDLITVTNAKHVRDLVLHLTFSDGISADVDFSYWIEKYPFFTQLRDVNYFKGFALDGWTVTWPNGADIAPETLHEHALRSLERLAA